MINYACDKRIRTKPIEYIVIRSTMVLDTNSITDLRKYLELEGCVKEWVPDILVKDNDFEQINDFDKYFCWGISISPESNFYITNGNVISIFVPRTLNTITMNTISRLVSYLKITYPSIKEVKDYSDVNKEYIERKRKEHCIV